MKQQKPQEERILIQAMATLKFPKNATLDIIHLTISLLGDRLKTLTNQTENLISQQEMPQNPENVFLRYVCFACFCFPRSG